MASFRSLQLSRPKDLHQAARQGVVGQNSIAKQGESLPQRQVLEREVSAGPQRRTKRAQQSEYEGHCPPWLARRWAIVQSLGQDFGKRQVLTRSLGRLLLLLRFGFHRIVRCLIRRPVVGQNSIRQLVKHEYPIGTVNARRAQACNRSGRRDAGPVSRSCATAESGPAFSPATERMNDRDYAALRT